MLRFYTQLFIFITLFSFPSFSIADECSSIFGSRLYYEERVVAERGKFRALHPSYTDPARERELVESWNKEPPTPFLLKRLLPEDTQFINHQLYQPQSAAVVKLDEPGSTVMVRVHYKYQNRDFETNVAFSRRALADNKNSQSGKNWLVGENAKAAILFLHGGGTKSTGSHVGSKVISHYRNYDIDVLSIDLPWHANGHRQFLDLESEIRSMGVLVQKYIPPNVPLFVWGHSWGSVFAEQLMRMTDRPHKEFFFHHNLKGAIILSTAVDAAPGKSLKEKQDAFFKRSQTVKDHIENYEQAESETNFWSGIINDGKFSALGAFYSASTIFQLNQLVPAHKGRKYIPALMVVGKHDSLVYFGFEDLYEHYKKLKNIETHYIEEPLPYYRNKDLQRVGHLLGDYLDPKTGEPIDFSLASKFMAKQLALDSMRGSEIRILNALEAIRNNDFRIEDTDLKTEIDVISNPGFLDRIDNQQIVDGLLSLKNDVLSGNTVGASTTIQALQKAVEQLINNKVDSSTIDKTKDKTISDFIRLLQIFSNNLAFREFIADHVYYSEKNTDSYASIFKEKLPNIRVELSDILNPYATPVSRITNILNDALSYIANLSKLKSVNENLSQLVGIPDVTKGISPKLLTDLKTLNTLITELLSELSVNNNTELIRTKQSAIEQKIQDMKENYEKFFNSIARSNRRQSPPLVSKLFSVKVKSMDDVHAMNEINQLPPAVKEKVIVIMTQYFEFQSIINGTYIPTMNDIKKIGINDRSISEGAETRRKTKGKIRNTIQKLHTLSKKKKAQLQLKREWEQKRDELQKKHKALLEKVRHHIKEIKEKGLEVLPNKPPASMSNEYKMSKKELKELEKAGDEMEKVMEQIAAQSFETKQPLSTKDIIKLINENRPIIDKFNELFSQYVRNRAEIREQAISAIENGEMGLALKQDVIAIYGKGSMGKRPTLGSEYIALEKLIQELAQAEAQVQAIKGILSQINMEYNKLMNSLLKLTKNTQTRERELLELAANARDIEKITLKDILDGKLGTISTDTIMTFEQKEEVKEYIDTHNLFFIDAVSTFSKLKSSLPPLLPTD